MHLSSCFKRTLLSEIVLLQPSMTLVIPGWFSVVKATSVTELGLVGPVWFKYGRNHTGIFLYRKKNASRKQYAKSWTLCMGYMQRKYITKCRIEPSGLIIMLILLISCAMKLKKQSQSQFLQKLYSDIDTITKCINYRIFSSEFITEKYT